ncbi:hypothetical protein V1520DRAFT_347153 [Lipomyces starkeyi]|uniref:Uncharacterized protein n=1 Tax=Lipomyces starkeyi NRRL Y-11557 TaxID=675824 RepID=A0A1E3QE60_LIPST|nr:hypothetical protein LIPSTDRAFT_223592 [Lipomyces starkeyi NRRL Y-11557]
MKVVNKYNGCNILTCTLLSVYVRNFDPEQGRTTMPIVVFTTRADHASWLLLLLRNVAKDRFGEGPQDRIKAIWAGIQTNDWTKEFFARPNAKVDEVDVLVTTSDILTLQPRDLPSAVRGCRLEPVARYRLPEVYVLHFRSRQLIEGAEADVSRLFNEYYDQYKISVLLIQATGVITGPANCPVENLILKPLDEIQRWVTAATMELMAGRTGPVRAVFIVAWATLWGMSCYCSVPSQS